MILDTQRKRRTTAPQYQTTTIRQFDGGWNVIDNELTLSPRYARVLDNFVRGADGSQSVRFGYGIWKDLQTGVVQAIAHSPTVSTTNLSRRVVINWTAHGLTSGNHITIAGLPTINGIPAAELNRKHTVRVIDANSFSIIVSTAATSTATTAALPITGSRDTHIASNVVNGVYYADRILVVTETGEVITISSDLTTTVIWNDVFAYALSGNPIGWGATEFVSFNVFGGKLKIHNGFDKPLEVDFSASPVVAFLGDPASGGSNTFVPVGRVGFSTGGYALVADIDDDSSKLQISAHLADGVWVGNPSPDDAVDVDLSKVTVSFDASIVGIGELRDKLIVAFRDSLSVGTLGVTKVVGAATLHDPQFKDSIPQHGTISHRSIVSLGNDIFMCDRVGVPSVGLSAQSGQFIPDRVSDFIEPSLQANLSRLSNDTLKNKVWAIFNTSERQYMLFMPRFDADDLRELDNDPITIVTDLDDDEFIVKHQGHNLEEGDTFVLSGATDIGANAAASFNGTWSVNTILDGDYFTVKTGTPFVETDITGGGPDVEIRATTDETNCYVFAYNPKLKIKSWSRFRDLNFDWGTRSAHGQLFFGKHGKIYRWGSQQYPYSADQVGDYDNIWWYNSTPYSVGDRIYDVVDDTVYVCLVAHTSAAAGSFATDRANFPENWEEYIGEPIRFAWEWPWGDFDKRLKTKAVGAIFPDTVGKGQFDIKLFVDELYKNEGGDLTPVRTMSFTAGGSGGYGAGDQPFGGGRRTREQLLWPIPVLCKLYKLRIEGETTDPLRIVAISIIYKEGSMKR